MPKRNNKVASKAKREGKLIARQQHEIHGLKGAVHKGMRPQRNRAANQMTAAKKITKLLTTKEEQQVAWSYAVSSGGDIVARMPVSEVSGLVPVDMYKFRLNNTVMVGTGGIGFCMMYADGWHRADGYGTTIGYLHADGATAYSGSYSSTSSWAGSAFPAIGAFGVNTAGITIPNISSDFNSDGDVGTEYIQVACKCELAAQTSAAANGQFKGIVAACYTEDPERYPIVGKALYTLLSDAAKPGSGLHVALYRITNNGLFVPYHLATVDADGRVTDEGAHSSLHMVGIPQTVDAYKWSRIGYQTLGTSVLGVESMGFLVFGATPGDAFMATTQYLYQTERYGSYKVTKDMWGAGAFGSTGSELSSIFNNAAALFNPGTGMPTHAGALSVVGNAAGKPGVWSQIVEHGPDSISNVIQVGGKAWDLIKQYGPGILGAVGSVAGVPGAGQLGSFLTPAAMSGSLGPPPYLQPGWVEVLPEVEEGIEFAAEILPMIAA